MMFSAVDEQGRDRALGQAGIHAEREVGARGEFLDRRVEDLGEALAAIFLRHGQAHPPAARIGVVGSLEARRGGHRPVGMADAPLPIARQIDGGEDLVGELAAFPQDGFDHVRRRVTETAEVGPALKPQHVVQEEQGVVDRGAVMRHSIFPHLTIRAAIAGRPSRSEC